ncbi:hypothetical protein ES332_A06G104100v1 [Gossypium tomentosum]|uniref:Uncharacterized protein n=1 Tax=Gossypium tomentosum TaxID=34277 RepID=A0A5D2Q1Y4_GOSTO|nr:hypothetical protein ES332_A06G104100v1 [Gossypium tomentosum]
MRLFENYTESRKFTLGSAYEFWIITTLDECRTRNGIIMYDLTITSTTRTGTQNPQYPSISSLPKLLTVLVG